MLCAEMRSLDLSQPSRSRAIRSIAPPGALPITSSTGLSGFHSAAMPALADKATPTAAVSRWRNSMKTLPSCAHVVLPCGFHLSNPNAGRDRTISDRR